MAKRRTTTKAAPKGRVARGAITPAEHDRLTVKYAHLSWPDPEKRADIKIRMNELLRARLEIAAAERGVSMNAEMIWRLERSFASDEAQDVVREIADSLREVIDQYRKGK